MNQAARPRMPTVATKPSLCCATFSTSTSHSASSGQGIASHAHRRCSRVIRLALEGNPNATLAGDRRHHAHRLFTSFEHRTLFDVRLEVGDDVFRCAFFGFELLGSGSPLLQHLFEAVAVVVRQPPAGTFELTGVVAAAEVGGLKPNAFFISKTHDLQLEGELNVPGGELFHAGDSQQHAEENAVRTCPRSERCRDGSR